MQIEIPEITPTKFGKLVLEMLSQVTVHGVDLRLVAMQHMAVDLANGKTTIVDVTEPPAAG